MPCEEVMGQDICVDLSVQQNLYLVHIDLSILSRSVC